MNDVKRNNFTLLLAIFWLIFWLFNGFDKFLFHTDIGWLTWYGKDRDWQFLTYFTNMHLPTEWVKIILYISGCWELLIGVVFGYFIALQWVKKTILGNVRQIGVYQIGLKLALLTFIGFCGFDIVAGDRAELLEHSTYVGLVGICYLIFMFENQTQTSE